jgi:PTS system glucitol/sorbitol-specific IIA component
MTDRQVKFHSVVISVGEMAEEFRTAGILVLFGEGVPEELEFVSVVHRPDVTTEHLAPGDIVAFGGEEMEILAVGDVASENFVNLGHLSLKRNGETTAALPGDVCTTVGPIPLLGPGDEITIYAAPEGSRS